VTLHSATDFDAIVDEWGREKSPDPSLQSYRQEMRSLCERVEASTVAKLAAAGGDWQERWFRVLGRGCNHMVNGELNLVCGDCALQLAREAVAELQAAHERELASAHETSDTYHKVLVRTAAERDEWKTRALSWAAKLEARNLAEMGGGDLAAVRALIEAAHRYMNAHYDDDGEAVAAEESMRDALAAVDYLRERRDG